MIRSHASQQELQRAYLVAAQGGRTEVVTLRPHRNALHAPLLHRRLGHTQVNAADLRSLRYPAWDELVTLGRRVGTTFPAQQELDRLIEEVVLP